MNDLRETTPGLPAAAEPTGSAPPPRDHLSLYASHQMLLAGSADAANESGAAAERARVAELARLPERPLTLSRRRRYIRTAAPWVGVMALAAGLCLMLWPRLGTPAPDYTSKGAAKIFVLVDDQSGRALLREGVPLTSGARVSAEIVAGEASVAWLAVYDRRGQLLTDAPGVVANRLSIGAGQRTFFKQCIELTGENEGETLAVVVCDQRELERLYPDPLEFVRGMLGTKPDAAAFRPAASVCGFRLFPLRW